MNEIEQIEGWRGQTVVDSSGQELGRLDEIFFDVGSSDPVLIAVKSGLLGRHSTLIPLTGATFGRDYVRVAHTADTIAGAGDFPGAEGVPDHETLVRLGSAYGIEYADDLQIESAAERETRNAEAEEARRRAAELAEAARTKIAERDAAGERAQDARAEAERAHEEAEQARQAALEAREQARRYE